MIQILIRLACGLLAGLIAGRIINGQKSCLWASALLGLIGANVGETLLGWLHISVDAPYYVDQIITATIGALFVLWLATKVKE